LTQEVTRQMWGRGVPEQWWRDVRYGWRSLRKSPLYAAVAVLTLALGIGANSAIFSVVHAVLVKGMPYAELDRLLFVTERLPKSPVNVAWPDYLDWRAQAKAFDRMAVFQSNRVYFARKEEAKMIPAGFVSASYFSTLGIRMAMGRAIAEDEDRPGAERVAVLSNRFWRSEMQGDPAIVGKSLWLDGRATTVVGVVAPEFPLEPWNWDVLTAISPRTTTGDFTRMNHPGLAVIARMRPGVTLTAAQSDLNTIMARLAAAYPETNRNETAEAIPLAERLVGKVRQTLLILLGAVGFVLLMTCANVAHLALARSSARQREFAIRAALGAGRLRLMRQLAVESMMLVLTGGLAGLLVAYWSVPSMVRLYPEKVPGLNGARVDGDVLLFAAAICIAAGVLFGMAPMLQAARAGVSGAMQEGSAVGGGRQGQRMRSLLFAAEIAIAIVVTVGAGLLLRSLAAVLHVDPGFRVDRLLALDVTHAARPQDRNDVRFFTQAAEQVSHLAGVQGATAVMCPPLGGSTCWTSPYAEENDVEPPSMQKRWTALNQILPNYFAVMGTPLVEGRAFTERDDKAASPVAIVNQTLAHRLWPGTSAVGKRIRVKFAAGQLLEVVGVAADMRQFGLDTAASAEVFVPLAQMPVSWMTVVARTGSSEPLGLAHAATQAIANVEGSQPPPKITTMAATLAETVAQRRFAAFLLGLFGGLALLLAAVGVSGVMAYSVAQRAREFGIRLAIGAERRQVVRMVLGQGLLLALAGGAIGLGAAWELARLLSKMLFGVTVHDPLTFAVSAGLLVAVALAACVAPAWRAAGVDPIRCLRCD
jgi:putative ABC transport system permease protein